MTNNSSIHIVAAQPNSERHNFRTSIPDYVEKDLISQNISYSTDTISNRLEIIKKKYKESVGQKMQKKATPIKEGVVNLKDVSAKTMEKLKELSNRLEDELGIRCFQIHIHADEGRFDPKKKEGEEKNWDNWKPNYHAHMVFDFTNEQTGKSVRLGKQHMRKMQDIVAEVMEMNRGKSSGKEHLHHIQYKAQKEAERNLLLQEQNKILEQKKNRVRARIEKLRTGGAEIESGTNSSSKEALRRIIFDSETVHTQNQEEFAQFDENDLNWAINELEKRLMDANRAFENFK